MILSYNSATWYPTNTIIFRAQVAGVARDRLISYAEWLECDSCGPEATAETVELCHLTVTDMYQPVQNPFVGVANVDTITYDTSYGTRDTARVPLASIQDAIVLSLFLGTAASSDNDRTSECFQCARCEAPSTRVRRYFSLPLPRVLTVLFNSAKKDPAFQWGDEDITIAGVKYTLMSVIYILTGRHFVSTVRFKVPHPSTEEDDTDSWWFYDDLRERGRFQHRTGTCRLPTHRSYSNYRPYMWYYVTLADDRERTVTPARIAADRRRLSVENYEIVPQMFRIRNPLRFQHNGGRPG